MLRTTSSGFGTGEEFPNFPFNPAGKYDDVLDYVWYTQNWGKVGHSAFMPTGKVVMLQPTQFTFNFRAMQT